MHLCRPWIMFAAWAACLAPVAGQALVVYKWTDAQGVVHFSDQPVPGAEKVTTSSAPERAGILGPAATPGSVAPKDTPKATPLASARVSITSPGPEQTFTGGESVPVSLAMEPEPKAGWTVVWSLNGAQVQGQPPDARSFTLSDLPRGVYTIEATVTDVTGESKAADPVTFNVLRPSLLSPQHK